jgi:hypothetical protein
VASPKWLYLFSSNRSPLYAQDILNVLAAPAGGRYRFRYDAGYVEDVPPEEGGEGTATKWEQIEAGTPVLVLFSLQQQAQYVEPVFIPIRKGEVLKRPYAFGSRLFVEFRLGTIVALPVPTSSRDPDYADRVRQFTDYVEGRTKTPYRYSASLGDPIPGCTQPPPPWDVVEDQNVLFERAGAYLVRTDTFHDAQFIRVLTLSETGSEQAIEPTPDGTFELDAGRTYDLALLHAQRAAPASPLPYVIDVDGTILHTIGRPGFDIASRYDRVVLRIAATQAPGLEDRETVLTVEPGDGVQGARVELPIRVRANRKQALGIAGVQRWAFSRLPLPASSPGFTRGSASASRRLAHSSLLDCKPLVRHLSGRCRYPRASRPRRRRAQHRPPRMQAPHTTGSCRPTRSRDRR